jgi:hypothetical protein
MVKGKKRVGKRAGKAKEAEVWTIEPSAPMPVQETSVDPAVQHQQEQIAQLRAISSMREATQVHLVAV